MLENVSDILYIPPKYSRQNDIKKTAEDVIQNSCTVCHVVFNNNGEMRSHFKEQSHLDKLMTNLIIDHEDDIEEVEEVVIVDKNQLLICKSNDNVVGLFPQLLTESIWNQLTTDTLNKYLSTLRKQKWGFLMLSGGDFAGAIIDLSTGKALEHKSIHRYTTRRKQGGGQSSYDQSNGKASSAGSSIRRYNEQALVKDIIEFISTSKELINCSTIWLYGAKKNEIILKNCLGTVDVDIELKKIPISCGKPTFNALMTCFHNLTTYQNASFEVITLIKPPIESSESEVEQQEIVEPIVLKKKKKKKKKKPVIIDDEVVDMRTPLTTKSAKESVDSKLIKPVDRVPNRQKMLEATMNRLNSMKCKCGKPIDPKNSFEQHGIKFCSINCLKSYLFFCFLS